MALCALLAAAGVTVPRADAAEHYDVYLEDGSAQRVRIGALEVEALDVDGGFRFRVDDAAFGDYFLSMRPFRCIARGEGMLCYLAYPYENRRRLGRDDLTDLEYDLLFIARSATEYGIDPWNGRYFRLRWEGDSIVGTMFETDLNVLAAPPADGSLRPLDDAEMVPVANDGNRWAPTLRIEAR